MQTMQQMQRKLKSAADLHGVVKTMKSLAAVSIRQYQDAAESLDEYFETVELALRGALQHRPLSGGPPPPEETVLLLFGSEQGMVGRFNEAACDHLQAALAAGILPGRLFRPWVVGARVFAPMEDLFGTVEETFGLPSSVDGITGAVQEILLRFAGDRHRHGQRRLVVIHNTPAGAAAYRQQTVHLLPPDRRWLEDLGDRRWPGRPLPFYTLPWEELFGALVGEYLFVGLARAFAASLAAENAARLAAMQRAEKNIEETRDELTRTYHSMRQDAISEELFDVISGFEALTGKGGGDDSGA